MDSSATGNDRAPILAGGISTRRDMLIRVHKEGELFETAPSPSITKRRSQGRLRTSSSRESGTGSRRAGMNRSS
jgi:hypothetical protein